MHVYIWSNEIYVVNVGGMRSGEQKIILAQTIKEMTLINWTEKKLYFYSQVNPHILFIVSFKQM